HNRWGFEDYLNIIRWVKERRPDLSVKAYTAVEIDFFCRRTKRPAEWVLAELKAAGLDALPGGGAEVFSERVRREIFHQKIGAGRWLEIHEIAHRLGIPSNCTLLYGHIETRAERVHHLIQLRELGRRAGPHPRPWPRAERRRPAAPHDFGRSAMAHHHSPGFLAVVNAAKSRVRQFTIEDYRARVARGEKWVLVDVREDHEWDAGHLP